MADKHGSIYIIHKVNSGLIKLHWSCLSHRLAWFIKALLKGSLYLLYSGKVETLILFLLFIKLQVSKRDTTMEKPR